MRMLLKIMTLTAILAVLAFGRNYQVTTIQGLESLDAPVLDIQGTTARVTHNTNIWFYNFPVTGPNAPIPTSSAVHPRPVDGGPLNCVLRGNGISAYLAYIIPNTELNRWQMEYVMSPDGGSTWTSPLVLDSLGGGSLSGYADNVLLEVSAKGNLYCIWRNQADSNQMHMARSLHSGVVFEPSIQLLLTDSAHTAKALSLQVVTVRETDNLLITYSVDTNLYVIRSSDEGVTFDAPVKILNITGMGSYIGNTRLAALANGTLYLAYGFFEMHPFVPGEGMPNDAMGTVLLRSTDFGAHWAFADTLDPGPSVLLDLKLSNRGTLVLTKAQGANLFLRSSSDGTLWSDSEMVNLSENTATGHWAYGFSTAWADTGFVGIAWIDTSTGNDEIFYRLMPVPALPTTMAEGTAPEEDSPALEQNSPNPFNPATQIRFRLSKQEKVRISLLDIKGRELRVLTDAVRGRGAHTVTLNAVGLSSGIYLCKMQTATGSAVRKVILAK